MARILVVDDMPFCREPLAQALRLHGHETFCAADGDEAFGVIRQHHPDLVLLDVNMPRMDGITTLRTIRRNPELRALPVILLTEQSDREYVIEAAKCGIVGYILKSSFKLDELLARIEQCLGPESAGAPNLEPATAFASVAGTGSARTTLARPRPREAPKEPSHPGVKRVPVAAAIDSSEASVTGDALLAHLCKDLHVRPLGVTVQDVLSVTASSGCSAEDVARAVENDPALCLRLLRLASSSAYSRGKPVNSVKDSVQRLGIQEVRNLVMTLDVLDTFRSAQQGCIDFPLFWEHSVACGLIAGAIAKAVGTENACNCFLWGTLHDIGRLILATSIPGRYAAVQEAAMGNSEPLQTAERKCLRLDHCDVLAKALEKWNFPRDCIVPTASHHLSVRRLERLAQHDRVPATIIALANRLTHALLLGSSGNRTVQSFGDYMDALEIDGSTIHQIAETVPAEVNDLKLSMLARSNADAWNTYAAQTRSSIAGEVRPLIVDSSREGIAYRLLFGRLSATDSPHPPNVAVIVVLDPARGQAVWNQLENMERDGGLPPLPVLAIVSRESAAAELPTLRAREHRTVTDPVSIGALATALSELVS